MDDKNPFESPQATMSVNGHREHSKSVWKYSLAGGGIGMIAGVLGVVTLFLVMPGAPGIFELLILMFGICILFVLPGTIIGVIVAIALNSRHTDHTLTDN